MSNTKLKLAKALVKASRGLKHFPTDTNKLVVAKSKLADSTLRDQLRKAQKAAGAQASA